MLKIWGIILFFATFIFFLNYLVCHAAIPTDHEFIKNNPDIIESIILSMSGVISVLFVFTFNRFNKSIDTLNTNLSLLNGEVGIVKTDVAEIKGYIESVKAHGVPKV